MDVAARLALFRQYVRRERVGMVEAPLWRTFFAWADAGYYGLQLSVRFPFFDLRLLEFVRAIPPAPWLEDKRLLRAAMGDRLPEVVRTRPKTLMAGYVTSAQNKQTGVPAWEIDLLTGPEMAAYVDDGWLRSVVHQSAAAQAHIWETQYPPVQLAYWLRYRRRLDRRARASAAPGSRSDRLLLQRSFKTGEDYATARR